MYTVVPIPFMLYPIMMMFMFLSAFLMNLRFVSLRAWVFLIPDPSSVILELTVLTTFIPMPLVTVALFSPLVCTDHRLM